MGLEHNVAYLLFAGSVNKESETGDNIFSNCCRSGGTLQLCRELTRIPCCYYRSFLRKSSVQNFTFLGCCSHLTLKCCRSDKDEQDAEVEPSMLGLQSHWDSTYADELANFHEHGDAGEIW